MRTQKQIFKEAPRYRSFYTCDLWRGYVHDTENGRATAISQGATHFAPLTFHRLDPGGNPAFSRWGCFYYQFRTKHNFEAAISEIRRVYLRDQGNSIQATEKAGFTYDLYIPSWLFPYEAFQSNLHLHYNTFSKHLTSFWGRLGLEVVRRGPSNIPAEYKHLFREAPNERIFIPSSLHAETLRVMRSPPPPESPIFPPIKPLTNSVGEIACGQGHSVAGVKCAITLLAYFRAGKIEEFTQRDASRAVTGTFTLDFGVLEALRILVATGHIVKCPELFPLSTGGRSHWFLVNPGIRSISP